MVCADHVSIGKTGQKRVRAHKLYLIKTRGNSNTGELAEKLIALKPIERVSLTEGSCGFIVRVRFIRGKEPSSVTLYISKNISSKYGKVVERNRCGSTFVGY